MKGKNDSTTYLPLKSKIGGPFWYGKDGKKHLFDYGSS